LGAANFDAASLFFSIAAVVFFSASRSRRPGFGFPLSTRSAGSAFRFRRVQSGRRSAFVAFSRVGVPFSSRSFQRSVFDAFGRFDVPLNRKRRFEGRAFSTTQENASDAEARNAKQAVSPRLVRFRSVFDVKERVKKRRRQKATL